MITKRLQGNRRRPGLKRWSVPIAVIAVLLTSVAAVAMIAGDDPPSAVKIGALYPLTGENAKLGKEVYNGVRFAVDYINDGYDPELTLELSAGAGLPRLGGAKLKLVKADSGSYRDSKTYRCKVRKAFNELVDRDRVAAVIGAYESTITLQAIIAADRRRVPFVNEGFYRTVVDDAERWTRGAREDMR